MGGLHGFGVVDCVPVVVDWLSALLGALMFEQLDNLDPTPVEYSADDALIRVIPHTVTVGCAFGSIVEVPKIQVCEIVDTSTLIFYNDELPPILDNEAVEVCKRISAALHQCECSEMGLRRKCGQCDG